MTQKETLNLLEQVSAGELSPQQALLQLKMEPFEELGFAKVDHHRGPASGSRRGDLWRWKNPGADQSHRSGHDRPGRESDLITRVAAEARSWWEKAFPAIRPSEPGWGLWARCPRLMASEDRGGHRRHQRYAGGGGSGSHR